MFKGLVRLVAQLEVIKNNVFKFFISNVLFHFQANVWFKYKRKRSLSLSFSSFVF
jgi:hypothetical protein